MEDYSLKIILLSILLRERQIEHHKHNNLPFTDKGLLKYKDLGTFEARSFINYEFQMGVGL